MSDQEILSRFVENNPLDKTAALVLVDLVQEQSNGSRRDALKWAARLRWPGRQAHYIGQASRLFASRRRGLTSLFDLIYASVGEVVYSDYPVLLIGGFRPPRIMETPNYDPEFDNWSESICVGARWVMVAYRAGLKAKKRWALDLAKAEWLDR